MCRWRTAMNYLAGLVYGDGSLYYYANNNEYFVYVYDNNLHFLKTVGEMIKSAMGVNYTIVRPTKRHNYYRLQIMSKEVYDYVKKLLTERPKRPTKNFVRGLIDAEGSIYNDRGRLVFQFGITDYRVAKAVYDVLQKEGIKATFVTYEDKRGNRKTLYKVYVRGEENIRKLIEKFKPLHPKITLKFEKLVASRGT